MIDEKNICNHLVILFAVLSKRVRSQRKNLALAFSTLNFQVFMSELDGQIPTAFGMLDAGPCFSCSSSIYLYDFLRRNPLVADPFADANADDSGAGAKEYVHVRIQQRNGRKSLTTVQGLKKELSYNKILKDLKKEFCCNGTVVQDPELGQVNLIH